MAGDARWEQNERWLRNNRNLKGGRWERELLFLTDGMRDRRQDAGCKGINYTLRTLHGVTACLIRPGMRDWKNLRWTLLVSDRKFCKLASWGLDRLPPEDCVCSIQLFQQTFSRQCFELSYSLDFWKQCFFSPHSILEFLTKSRFIIVREKLQQMVSWVNNLMYPC